MTTPTHISAPDAYAPLSTAEKLEEDASLAGAAAGTRSAPSRWRPSCSSDSWCARRWRSSSSSSSSRSS